MDAENSFIQAAKARIVTSDQIAYIVCLYISITWLTYTTIEGF